MGRRLLAALLLALAVAWGAWIRIDTALSDPAFDASDARGMLRSDPALLYYFTERIVEAGGSLPADFRHEARIQHPFVTDVPAEFPLGQEFLVAWAQLLLGGQAPLHLTALRVMALCAALFVLGTYLAARALTGSRAWAALAAALALLTPANYRTIGFLLVGEDLSLPLFALHLGALARAWRVRTAGAYAAAGLLAALALATWHAMSFVLGLEVGLVFVFGLWSARAPFASPGAAWVLAAPLAAGVLVPVLRASGLLLSPMAALVLALATLSALQRRRALAPWTARALLAALALLGVLGLGALAPDAYAHVHDVVWAKLVHLGRFPADPEALSFDARLLWQGPFETLSPRELLAWCGWPLALGGLAAVLPLSRAATPERFTLAFLGLALVAALLFQRLVVLIGLVAPVAVALALARAPWRRVAPGLALLLLAFQAARFAGFVADHRLTWYLPRASQAELATLIERVRAGVPEDEAIAGDFVNSTALLAHARRPIVLQPKYETDRSRRQAEAFLTTFFHGSTQDLAALLAQRFSCRYLLVDRYVLWELSRATAGLAADTPAPPPGSAAEAFLSDDDATLRAIPGFELLYRSPRGLPASDYRLFRGQWALPPDPAGAADRGASGR